MKRPRLARTDRVEKARSLSDEALLEDLHRLGITMDASGLRVAANAHASAEAFAQALNADLRPRLRGAELDELRADLTVLWERSSPPSPQPATFEAIEESMRAGYLAQMRGDQAAAARAWMRTWDAVAAIARERGFATIEEVDQAFRGTEYVFNWVQDLDDAFHNSGLDDHRFWEDGLRIADEVLRLFPNESALFTENKRRVIAESHAKLGHRAVSDDLYRSWLAADPAWGWGWIGWADTYYLLVRGEERDAVRAESILHDGLAVVDVRDRPDILDRLVALYEDTGREDEATETRRRLRELEGRPAEPSVTVSRDPETGSGKVAFDFGEEGLPLERLEELPDRARRILAATGEVTRKKVGRNEPCPCGSGHKFKKCCGR